ncbi:MAG: pyruvate formate-lyase-activating protein [Marinifilaceae bacterium]|jgi:pyruvate formate lyase activating enzyme|nr:pyruvate formate-lyase-activating protein [Marinifilaceae bacterium]
MLKVHSFESLGTYDGPGIRLVVFLQGCAFKCLYCANPDTISFKGGTPTSVDEIMRMARNQKPFFGKKGGVTVSGGEPLWQAGELVKLFKQLKEEGFNTCLDSNGNVFNEDVIELMKYTDLVLLDIKHINKDWHKTITGKENATTLKLAKHLKDTGVKVWLRYVLVPGYSDQKEYLEELGEYFKDYDNIEKLEIQPYHKLGVHKYEHLKMKYELEGVPENTEEQLKRAKSILDSYFKEVIVN